MKKFLIIIEEIKTAYSSYVPDLTGCVATGKTKEEAQSNINPKFNSTVIFAIVFLFSILFFCFAGDAIANNDIDNRIYASLLEKYVRDNRVNYDGFKKDEKLLDEYLAILSRVDAKSLSRNSRFAFYINVYNANTIKLVLTKFPGINSIKEIGGFFSNPWKQKFISLNKRVVTLDYIEHEILRPRFKDPRVHFAINCASKSCPSLRNEPFEANKLEQQLDEQAKNFINDKKHNYIKENTFYISKIFKWFEDDFSENPLVFIKRYTAEELKENIKIKYLDYDWSLNR